MHSPGGGGGGEKKQKKGKKRGTLSRGTVNGESVIRCTLPTDMTLHWLICAGTGTSITVEFLQPGY